MKLTRLLPLAVLLLVTPVFAASNHDQMSRLAYNQPGLVTDLGTGLWGTPLPMDYNGDGLMDLIMVCPDKPHHGTWFFENSGQIDAQTHLPLFKSAVLLGPPISWPAISYVTGKPIVTGPGTIYPNFSSTLFKQGTKFSAPEKIHPEAGNIRQNQWKVVDYDGDGVLDLTVGIDFWGDYGWDNAFDAEGHWKQGPLHGYVYLLRNTGTNEKPVYAAPVKVEAGGKPVDPFGMPSPMWGDFDGDGDLDLICGEFLDGFTYYENIGTRTAPRYAAGRPLMVEGQRLHMDLCMITPTAVDFDGDGKLDIVCGEEDGRVSFLKNTGKLVDGLPQFLAPRYFRQVADDVKFGALITPCAFDWDGDGKVDLIAGNSAGYLAFIKNLGGNPVQWAAPVVLSAEGKTIREQAGPNGSVQGPAETKWGYSIPFVADWDGDGLPDIITNGIWGRIVWYRNIGTRTVPKLAAAQPITVAWTGAAPKPAWNWWNPRGAELVTQWRTTPVIIDWNHDGLPDLVMSDSEGFLALYERRRAADGHLELLPPRRVFRGEGSSVFNMNGLAAKKESGLLQLNDGVAGKSGRRTFCIVDWDGDGELDLLVNSNPNVNFLRGLGRNAATGEWSFHDEGAVSTTALAGHATKPVTLDLNGDGLPDLLVGAEDGYLYQLLNPRTK